MQLSDLTSKKPEELNVMCAELLGWEFWSELAIGSDGKQQLWKHPEHKTVTNMDEHIKAFTYARAASQLPNYTGSWEAIMPEVRKLDDVQFARFAGYLEGVQPFLHPLQNYPKSIAMALILTLHP